MAHLASGALHAVLRTAAALCTYDTDPVRQGLPRLLDLLGGDVATYQRLDRPGRTDPGLAQLGGTVLGAESWPLYAQYLHRDPLTVHYRSTGDTRPLRLSDVTGPVSFRRTALDQEYYRHVPSKHRIALPVAGLPDQLVLFGVGRGTGSDFTAADVAVLALLAPHLARLHRQHAREDQQALARQHHTDRPPVSLPATWAVTSQVRPVPDQRGPTTSPAAAAAAAAAVGGTPAAGAPGTFARSGGLTGREQQILTLVRGGRTSASIGRELGVSTRTVDKHLENAYRKLGVTNRLAALTATHSDSA